MKDSIQNLNGAQGLLVVAADQEAEVDQISRNI